MSAFDAALSSPHPETLLVFPLRRQTIQEDAPAERAVALIGPFAIGALAWEIVLCDVAPVLALLRAVAVNLLQRALELARSGRSRRLSNETATTHASWDSTRHTFPGRSQGAGQDADKPRFAHWFRVVIHLISFLARAAAAALLGIYLTFSRTGSPEHCQLWAHTLVALGAAAQSLILAAVLLHSLTVLHSAPPWTMLCVVAAWLACCGMSFAAIPSWLSSSLGAERGCVLYVHEFFGIYFLGPILLLFTLPLLLLPADLLVKIKTTCPSPRRVLQWLSGRIRTISRESSSQRDQRNYSQTAGNSRSALQARLAEASFLSTKERGHALVCTDHGAGVRPLTNEEQERNRTIARWHNRAIVDLSFEDRTRLMESGDAMILKSTKATAIPAEKGNVVEAGIGWWITNVLAMLCGTILAFCEYSINTFAYYPIAVIVLLLSCRWLASPLPPLRALPARQEENKPHSNSVRPFHVSTVPYGPPRVSSRPFNNSQRQPSRSSRSHQAGQTFNKRTIHKISHSSLPGRFVELVASDGKKVRAKKKSRSALGEEMAALTSAGPTATNQLRSKSPEDRVNVRPYRLASYPSTYPSRPHKLSWSDAHGHNATCDAAYGRDSPKPAYQSIFSAALTSSQPTKHSSGEAQSSINRSSGGTRDSRNRVSGGKFRESGSSDQLADSGPWSSSPELHKISAQILKEPRVHEGFSPESGTTALRPVPRKSRRPGISLKEEDVGSLPRKVRQPNTKPSANELGSASRLQPPEAEKEEEQPSASSTAGIHPDEKKETRLPNENLAIPARNELQGRSQKEVEAYSEGEVVRSTMSDEDRQRKGKHSARNKEVCMPPDQDGDSESCSTHGMQNSLQTVDSLLKQSAPLKAAPHSKSADPDPSKSNDAMVPMHNREIEGVYKQTEGPRPPSKGEDDQLNDEFERLPKAILERETRILPGQMQSSNGDSPLEESLSSADLSADVYEDANHYSFPSSDELQSASKDKISGIASDSVEFTSKGEQSVAVEEANLSRPLPIVSSDMTGLDSHANHDLPPQAGIEFVDESVLSNLIDERGFLHVEQNTEEGEPSLAAALESVDQATSLRGVSPDFRMQATFDNYRADDIGSEASRSSPHFDGMSETSFGMRDISGNPWLRGVNSVGPIPVTSRSAVGSSASATGAVSSPLTASGSKDSPMGRSPYKRNRARRSSSGQRVDKADVDLAPRGPLPRTPSDRSGVLNDSASVSLTPPTPSLKTADSTGSIPGTMGRRTASSRASLAELSSGGSFQGQQSRTTSTSSGAVPAPGAAIGNVSPSLAQSPARALLQHSPLRQTSQQMPLGLKKLHSSPILEKAASSSSLKSATSEQNSRPPTNRSISYDDAPTSQQPSPSLRKGKEQFSPSPAQRPSFDGADYALLDMLQTSGLGKAGSSAAVRQSAVVAEPQQMWQGVPRGTIDHKSSVVGSTKQDDELTSVGEGEDGDGGEHGMARAAVPLDVKRNRRFSGQKEAGDPGTS